MSFNAPPPPPEFQSGSSSNEQTMIILAHLGGIVLGFLPSLIIMLTMQAAWLICSGIVIFRCTGPPVSEYRALLTPCQIMM